MTIDVLVIFFCKQKTAYEVRISDWSSDVCSSDLYGGDSMTRKTHAATRKPAALPAGYAGIHGGIVELLDAARQAAARSVNALMTASYWEIGRRIVEAEQKGRRRAGSGRQLMARLSADTTARIGSGLDRQRVV